LTLSSGTNIFAGTWGGGVFLSTNNGTSWTQVNNGLMNTVVRSLAVSGTNIFAGTSGGGVYLSTSNGASWTEVNNGLKNTYVYALAVSGTNLFAGTLIGGVWRRPLSEMITSVERFSTDLPTDFGLEQNYPNPFNPTTTIRFSLPHREHVTLKVFDVLGREVATLVDGELNPGEHSVVFSAKDLPSGVYFYRLTTPTFSQTKLMEVLK